MTLQGYDGRFGLRCWPADAEAAPEEIASDDEAGLRARAANMVRQGPFGRVELLAWNFELNDWIRMEVFEA